MKETIIALIVTIAIGVTILTAIHQGRAVTDLERHIAMLEREVEVRQSMLDDAHTLYQQMERRIAVVDTGMSARQMLWHIEEIAATSACIEVHQ
jgi:prefoldin subunit 5